MYVWTDKQNTQWIVHDGKQVITISQGSLMDDFNHSQEGVQEQYEVLHREFPGSKLYAYGVQLGEAFVTVKGGELDVMYSNRQPQRVKELEERVQQLNALTVQCRLTQDERQLLQGMMVGVVPDEYWDKTDELLESLTYQTDLHVVCDVLAILNTWVERDGFHGVLNYTEQGLQVDFNLDHPIVLHVGGYGQFSPDVDQTFLAWVDDKAELYLKVKQVFSVFLDFYKWVNPLDLSYQTNKILGDDRIRVTLKDPRVVEYQRQIREDFQEFQKRCREVKYIKLNFSHTTRSVYADIEFFNGVPSMRLSVRDHDNCYEEGITIIRINTLKAMNVVDKLEDAVQDYISKYYATQGVLKQHTNQSKQMEKEGVMCGKY